MGMIAKLQQQRFLGDDAHILWGLIFQVQYLLDGHWLIFILSSPYD
jgi:hypothetical protein